MLHWERLVENLNSCLSALPNGVDFSEFLPTLEELQAYASLYIPPPSPLPGLLCQLLRTALEVWPDEWVRQDRYIIDADQLLNTTVLYLHDAYAQSGVNNSGSSSSLQTTAALQLAQQLRSSGLLPLLPSVMKNATQAFSKSSGAMTSGSCDQSRHQVPAVPVVLLCNSSALLQLAYTIFRMWPGGAVKSNDVRPLIDPAAQLTLSMMHAAALPHQAQAGLRADMLLQKALAMTHCILQQLAQPLLLRQLEMELEGDVLARLNQLVQSAPLRQLMLLLLEVQLQQAGYAVASSSNASSSGSGTDDRNTSATNSCTTSNSISSPGGATTAVYLERLLQLTAVTHQQVSVAACSGRSGCSSSSSRYVDSKSDAAAGCVATLRVLAALLRRMPNAPPFVDSELSMLSIRLLHLAAENQPASSSSSGRSGGSSSYSAVSSAAMSAAKAAAYFVPAFGGSHQEELLQMVAVLVTLQGTPAAAVAPSIEAAAEVTPAPAAAGAQTIAAAAAGAHTVAAAAAASAVSDQLAGGPASAEAAAAAAAAAQRGEEAVCHNLTLLLKTTFPVLRNPRTAVSSRCTLQLVAALETLARTAVARAAHSADPGPAAGAGPPSAQQLMLTAFWRCLATLLYTDGQVSADSQGAVVTTPVGGLWEPAAAGPSAEDARDVTVTRQQASMLHIAVSSRVQGMLGSGGSDRLLSLLFSCEKAARDRDIACSVAYCAEVVCSSIANSCSSALSSSSSSSELGRNHSRSSSATAGTSSDAAPSSSSSSSSSSSVDRAQSLVLLLPAAPWLVLLARCTASKARHLAQLRGEFEGIAEAGLTAVGCSAAAAQQLQYALIDSRIVHYKDVAVSFAGDIAVLLKLFELIKTTLEGKTNSSSSSSSKGEGADSAAANSATGSSSSSSSSRWHSVSVVQSPAVAAAYLSGLQQCYGVLQQLQPAQESEERATERAAYVCHSSTQRSSSSTHAAAVQPAGRQPDSPEAVVKSLAKALLLMTKDTPELLQQVQQAMQQVCAELPLPHCCNHLGCSNLAGDSESGLVGGKGNLCSGCRVAR
jgi:hypothetical protein